MAIFTMYVVVGSIFLLPSTSFFLGTSTCGVVAVFRVRLGFRRRQKKFSSRNGEWKHSDCENELLKSEAAAAFWFGMRGGSEHRQTRKVLQRRTGTRRERERQ